MNWRQIKIIKLIILSSLLTSSHEHSTGNHYFRERARELCFSSPFSPPGAFLHLNRDCFNGEQTRQQQINIEYILLLYSFARSFAC